jgi:polyisoprenoid-binding protein YceI
VSDQPLPVGTDDADDVIPPPAGKYVLDPMHTFAEFRVRHIVVGKVRGRFDSISGEFVVTSDPERLFSDAEVRIDASSIDTNVEARDEDLRSERFFDVGNFPTLTFRSTESRRASANVWTIDGELTIRKITRPVSLDATVRGAKHDTHGNTKIGLTARASLSRSDFELTTELLEESGSAGGTDIEIEVDLEAVLKR